MKRLLVIQRRLTSYRVPFFERLKSECSCREIHLELACGESTEPERSKADAGNIDWAQSLETKYFLNGKICWQPFGKLLSNVDLVVVTQENKLVYNLVPQFLGQRHRFALWGHGANLQGDANSWRERFKAKVARRADWWFGYTEMSRPLITRNGFPNDRITILNNSVDTSEMRAHLNGLPANDRVVWRQANDVGSGPVGIFLGSLYTEKRIEFLLQAAQAIRQELPSFELVLVGAGPQRELVEAFCAANPWAHYLGTRNGLEKVRALAASDVMLNPGLVGLGILDSLVCGLPIFTTDCGLHSPEIAYLSNDHNGVMTSNDISAYVQAVLALLRSPKDHARMAMACRESGECYSVANMARNFADGVQACLAAPIYRGKA